MINTTPVYRQLSAEWKKKKMKKQSSRDTKEYVFSLFTGVITIFVDLNRTGEKGRETTLNNNYNKDLQKRREIHAVWASTEAQNI